MKRDHTLTSELVCFQWRKSQCFKVSRLMGSMCVCLCVQGGGFCHDSSAWIKCGTLIWVKIMESYMSLTMSAFHSRPKWKVTAGCDRGRGGQRFWNGNQVTMRPSLWLTLSQAEPGLTVIKRQAAKNLHPPIFCLCLPVSLGDIAAKLTGTEMSLHMISVWNKFYIGKTIKGSVHPS